MAEQGNPQMFVRVVVIKRAVEPLGVLVKQVSITDDHDVDIRARHRRRETSRLAVADRVAEAQTSLVSWARSPRTDSRGLCRYQWRGQGRPAYAMAERPNRHGSEVTMSACTSLPLGVRERRHVSGVALNMATWKHRTCPRRCGA